MKNAVAGIAFDSRALDTRQENSIFSEILPLGIFNICFLLPNFAHDFERNH